MDDRYVIYLRKPATWGGALDKRIVRWGEEHEYRTEVTASDHDDAKHVASTFVPRGWDIVAVEEVPTW
jgi:hypothetical protein